MGNHRGLPLRCYVSGRLPFERTRFLLTACGDDVSQLGGLRFFCAVGGFGRAVVVDGADWEFFFSPSPPALSHALRGRGSLRMLVLWGRLGACVSRSPLTACGDDVSQLDACVFYFVSAVCCFSLRGVFYASGCFGYGDYGVEA